MIIASDDPCRSETMRARLCNHYGVELWSSQDPLTGLSQAMMTLYLFFNEYIFKIGYIEDRLAGDLPGSCCTKSRMMTAGRGSGIGDGREGSERCSGERTLRT